MKLGKQLPIKPASGYSTALHFIIVFALPMLLFALVRLDFVIIAYVVLLLSKWRMFAIRMRHWAAIIRANAVDLLFGASIIAFMSLAQTQLFQVVWTAIYILWLLFIKPRSTTLFVGLQALIAQAAALSAIFLTWAEYNTSILVMATAVITYLSARHFMAAYDESMSRASAYTWAFFSSTIAWLAGHWLTFYGPVAQPALIITVIAYSMASLYYLDHRDRLSTSLRMQFVGIMIAVLLFIIIFSDWSGEII